MSGHVLNTSMSLLGFDASFCGHHLWGGEGLLGAMYVLPHCIHQTVLVWIPCLFLLLLSPLMACQALTDVSPPLPWTHLLIGKLSVTIVVILDAVILLLISSCEDQITPPVDFAHPVSLLFSMLMILTWTCVYRELGKRSSAALFLTWLLFAICGVPELDWWIGVVLEYARHCKHMTVLDVPRCACFVVWYSCVLTQVLLFSLSDSPSTWTPVDAQKTSPESNSSFLSRQTMWWFNGLCALGKKKPLEVHDLYSLHLQDSSAGLVPKWDQLWTRAMQQYNNKREQAMEQSRASQRLARHMEAAPILAARGALASSMNSTEKEIPLPECPSLVWRLLVLFRGDIVAAMILRLGSDLLLFANPFLLKCLIQYTEMPDSPAWHGVVLACAMFVASELGSLLLNNYFYLMYRVGTRMQTCLTSAVYSKALRLSNAARHDKTVGEIVNLMAVDIDRFQQLIPQTYQYWSTPMQVTIALYLLWHLIGVSVLSGIAVMVLLLPINFTLTMGIRQWQVRQMLVKDERTSMINEVLNGMKVIKLYAWEPPMEKVITSLRDRELLCIRKAGLLRTVSDMLNSASPFLVALSTFSTYLWLDARHVLTPQIAFVSLALFNQLRYPMSTVADLISQTVQATVSNARLKDFMVAPELEQYVDTTHKDLTSHDKVIEMEQASLTWDRHTAPLLKNLNVRIAHKHLVAIVGRVGSGKSSLLQSLLGEMDRIQGRIAVDGRIAYVPQQAWMQNATLRENVLFGHRFDEYFYGRVLDACELYTDIAMLSNGDQTEIGEKGINLSGGQKARLGLARAVYQNCDVYLLDDPLSAVDSHVGAQLFHNVIGPGGMLRNKTRLLVTHELSYLKFTDHILVLAEGEIVAEGSYTQLMTNGAFKQLLEQCETEQKQRAQLLAAQRDSDEFSDESELSDDDTLLAESPLIDQLLGCSHMSTVSGILSRSRYSSNRMMARRRKRSHKRTCTDDEYTARFRTASEHVQTGRVKQTVYSQYFHAMSLRLFVVFVVGIVLSSITCMARDIWLRDWSNENTLVVGRSSDDTAKPVNVRLTIYAILGFCEVGVLFAGMCALLFGAVHASRHLHAPLIHSILRAPMHFFDITPFGRILNRIGRDIETIDMLLPCNVQFFADCVLKVLSTFTIIMLSTPWFGVVVIPLALMYCWVLNYYLATSRQLKRLESITRSPIYSHLSEAVQGASTIRAFKSTQRLSVLCHRKVDTHVQCHYLNFVANRWLSIRLEFIGNCVVLFAALLAALSRNDTSAGVIGLSITYALNVTFVLNFAVRQISKLETNIVSVERVKEYAEMSPEAAWTSASWNKPPLGWPSNGKIELRSFSSRYRAGLDLVLKRLSITIDAHQKVGIVGRTGAGKSSIALGLFRIVEATEGCILIDGVDISRIGLHELRANIAIIPQDPVLFSGTLRFNLDPAGCYSDPELWLALEFAHLKQFVEAQPNKLEHVITEGGDNMSVGQRQLVCLARALLRKSKVLVLDEATAAVDMNTDALIQRTIKREFKNSTVLTIAHRLHTILDYDRIIVLDKGRIVESDSPEALLADSRSLFHGMAQSAGLLAEQRPASGLSRRSPRQQHS